MNKTFCELLVESCERYSERIAMRVVGDDSQDVTFGQLLKGIRSVSYSLSQKNISKGDRVAVVAENHPNWAIAYLGTLYHGAICVPIDPHGERKTLGNFFRDAEVQVIFTDDQTATRVNEIQKSTDQSIETVVWERAGGEDDFAVWKSREVPPDYVSEHELPSPDDTAVLIYTSGTTGKPKGVMLSHGNIRAELDAIETVIEFTERESILSLLPLFHVYLQIVNLWLAVTKGARAYYLKDLTPEELSKGMIESKMTTLASVPRLWYLFHKKIFDAINAKPKLVRGLISFLLKLNGFLRDTFGVNLGTSLFKEVHQSFGGNLQIAVTAGSRFDESVAIDFYRLGFNIVQGYGLSETSGAATGTYADDNRVGSVGKAMGDAEVKLDSPDESGEGEVLLKGSMIFQGYYQNPEATKAAFTEDGWFKSGDLGRFDKDGHLYITGRAKDVIVLPSGKNVHPEDLEVQYLKSPLVEEMCVIGIDDLSSEHHGDEKLVAVIVPDFEYLRANGIANSKEAIRYDMDNLGRELPEYQRVRDYIIRAEALPRTGSRKVKRFELRKALNEGMTDDFKQAPRKFEFSSEDTEFLKRPAATLVENLIRRQNDKIESLHPNMNLEIDLRLDSLGRAEIVAGIEQALKVDLPEEDVTEAFTFGEVVKLVEKVKPDLKNVSVQQAGFDWSTVVAEAPATMPETESILKARPVYNVFGFLVLKLANLFWKIAFGLEVRNRAAIENIDGPFLVCPNHQSFIDPFVVCSTYPYRVFRDTFHVGASEYFQSRLMSFVARVVKVVPVDPDSQLLKAMRAGAIGLRHGKILNIYPEGERAFDGKLHQFKEGASILSKELSLPIIPVAIDGLDKVWGRGSKSIKASKVTIEFCDPIDPSDFEDYGELTEHLKYVIQSKLDADSA